MIDHDNMIQIKLIKIIFKNKPYFREHDFEYYIIKDKTDISIKDNNISSIENLGFVNFDIQDFQNKEIETLLDKNAELYKKIDELKKEKEDLKNELNNYKNMGRLEKFVSVLFL